MPKSYLLYEKLHGKIKERSAKKFPVNEDAFGWIEHSLPKGAAELDFKKWKVTGGALIDISESVQPDAITVDDVKNDCYFLIKSGAPLWRQQNYTRRLMELQAKEALTEAETAEKAKIDALFNWVDAMRARCEELEQDPGTAFDNPNWPTPPSEA